MSNLTIQNDSSPLFIVAEMPKEGATSTALAADAAIDYSSIAGKLMKWAVTSSSFSRTTRTLTIGEKSEPIRFEVTGEPPRTTLQTVLKIAKLVLLFWIILPLAYLHRSKVAGLQEKQPAAASSFPSCKADPERKNIYTECKGPQDLIATALKRASSGLGYKDLLDSTQQEYCWRLAILDLLLNPTDSSNKGGPPECGGPWISWGSIKVRDLPPSETTEVTLASGEKKTIHCSDPFNSLSRTTKVAALEAELDKISPEELTQLQSKLTGKESGNNSAAHLEKLAISITELAAHLQERYPLQPTSWEKGKGTEWKEKSPCIKDSSSSPETRRNLTSIKEVGDKVMQQAIVDWVLATKYSGDLETVLHDASAGAQIFSLATYYLLRDSVAEQKKDGSATLWLSPSVALPFSAPLALAKDHKIIDEKFVLFEPVNPLQHYDRNRSSPIAMEPILLTNWFQKDVDEGHFSQGARGEKLTYLIGKRFFIDNGHHNVAADPATKKAEQEASKNRSGQTDLPEFEKRLIDTVAKNYPKWQPV